MAFHHSKHAMASSVNDDAANITATLRRIDAQLSRLVANQARTRAFLAEERLSRAPTEAARNVLLDAHLVRMWEDLDELPPYYPSIEDEDESERPPSDRVAVLVSPDYEALATVGHRSHRHITNVAEHERLYRSIHTYLTACGLLPGPLMDDPRPDMISKLSHVMHRRAETVTVFDTTQQRVFDLGKKLRRLVPTTRVLTLVLTGHGAPSVALDGAGGMGTLLMGRGERLDERWLMRALADFRGTLILVVGMCSAEGAHPLSADTAAAAAPASEPATLNAGSGFHPDCRVVRVMATERGESAAPDQMRRFAAFVEALVVEAPTYADLLQPERSPSWILETWRRVTGLASSTERITTDRLITAPPLVTAHPTAVVSRSGARFGEAVA